MCKTFVIVREKTKLAANHYDLPSLPPFCSNLSIMTASSSAGSLLETKMAATSAVSSGTMSSGIDNPEHVGKMIKFVKDALAVSLFILLGSTREGGEKCKTPTKLKSLGVCPGCLCLIDFYEKEIWKRKSIQKMLAHTLSIMLVTLIKY